MVPKRVPSPFLLGLVLVVSGCSQASPSSPTPTGSAASVSFPVRLHTNSGDVNIPRLPRRIVSLSASATQMLFAIGAGPQVVAVDHESTYPPSAPITDLSGFQPNIEAIASYRPDLVINDGDVGGLVRSFAALQVPVLLLAAAKSLDDSYAQMVQLGQATNHVGQAGSVVSALRDRIRQIVASVPKSTTSLRVYHELDQTHYSATSATFIGQIYKLFGLSNIADQGGVDANSGYPQLSSEFVVAANPQVVFAADTVCCQQTVATVSARPGWDHVDAVKYGQVIMVDDSLASQWGPRIGDYVDLVGREVKQAEIAYGTAPT